MINPTLALIPSAYKASKVYSILPSNGDGDFTFTRPSSATRVNSNGLIESVGVNVPRLDYSDGNCPSLLLEPQRTNLVTHSEDFSNAYWGKSGSSITSNVSISLDGTNNAFKLVEDTNNSKHLISRNNLFTPDGITRNYSIFVKEGERRYIFITNVTTTNNDINCVVFDTRNGVFTNTNDLTYISNRNVTTLENGWYRIDFSSNVNSGSYDNFYIGISLSETMSGVSYQGDGTSGVYIYAAQVEQGSYATSYIPTNGSIATRIVETCSDAGNASTFNDSEGVLYFEAKSNFNNIIRRLSLSDGTTNNRIILQYQSNGNDLGCFVVVNGSNQVAIGNISMSQEDYSKIAFKYKENDFAIWINGVEVFTDGLGSTYATNILSKFSFDDSVGSLPFFGKVKQLQYFDTALTDTELQELTTL